MKTYRTLEGDTVAAASSRQVISWLRDGSRDREANQEAFMRAVAARVQTQTGVQVPTHSEAAFVAALVQAGLLKEITDND